MLDSPDISIVIVNYNVKDYLLQCLRSIEKSITKLKFEVIVIDNNSNDGSVDFLEPLFPSYKFIRLEHNIGFGRANNFGFLEASGKYYLILNPDTILSEDTLESMYRYMESNPQVGISGCKVLNPDGSFQLACRRGFPTPWASFCKLFGLQTLFPKSKLFAKYNQTFRNIDSTYYIDSIVGAFMFARSDVIRQINGFDTDFFMYGEDIDLCYRAKKAGCEIAYVHTTSIIHFKGESTKRSSLNDVKIFYEAMEIFANKHYSGTYFFLFFLRLGIFARSFLAYLRREIKSILLLIIDTLIINSSLLVATKIRFNEFFNFPPYAYPTVFIVITLIMIASMISVGEYFEGKSAVRKSFYALLISFFLLSSLTYFFNEYAFSRGILLMTIGFSIILTSIARGLLSLSDSWKGKKTLKKIAIIGTNEQAHNIVRALMTIEARNADLAGIISLKPTNIKEMFDLPVIGNFEYLSKILKENKVRELIVTEPSLNATELIEKISEFQSQNIRIHFAQEYEELVSSRILNDIIGVGSEVLRYNLSKLRYKILKRFTDIIISFFSLILLLPVSILAPKKSKKSIRNLWLVFIGFKSIVGMKELPSYYPVLGKYGIISLIDIYKNNTLSDNAKKNLNDFYLKNFNLSLDLEIIFKYLMKRK